MDEFMLAADPVVPSPESIEPSSGLKAFLSTTLGRIVVIGSAITLFVAIAGVVTFLVLGSMAKSEQAKVDALNSVTAPQPTPAATRTVETSATEGNRVLQPVTNKDVFTARDPFEPVLKPLPPVMTATSSVETTPKPADAGMLTLQDIVMRDGVLKAVLLWEGDQYVAAEGEVLQNTPWQVLSITKTTVTMLYGDVQVTLSIGEGVEKD